MKVEMDGGLIGTHVIEPVAGGDEVLTIEIKLDSDKLVVQEVAAQ